MSVDINKILAVSARVAFALLVSCLILIFFPAAWLPFDISSFREEYGIWLFFVMVLSVSILFSYIAKWCVVWVRKLIDRRKLWNKYYYDSNHPEKRICCTNILIYCKCSSICTRV